MKTPEEIKKGLECCMDYQSCTEYEEPKCPYNDVTKCMEALLADALAYIQQLESDLQKEKDMHQYTIDAANVMKDEALKLESSLAQAERERDAALGALRDICSFCKGHCLEISGGYMPDCEHCMIKNYSSENTKEE